MAFGWDDVAIAGIGLFGNLFGAHKQASAAEKAAKVTADAAKYAADLGAKANADALTFTRSQAQNAFANSEAARQGNYGQWAAGQHRLGSVGELIGMGPREIPAYVPGVDPRFTDSGGAASLPSAGQAATMPGINFEQAPDKLAADLTGFFQSRGVAPTEVPYWVAKAGELVARGKEIGDPQYANRRLAAAEIFGGGQVSTPGKPVAAIGSVGSYLAPYAQVPLGAGVQRPMLGSVGSYF